MARHRLFLQSFGCNFSDLAKPSKGLTSKDHYDLIAMFDRIYKGERLDKEDKSLWAQGNVYQSGETNKLFLAFRQGVAYGQHIVA